MRQTIELFAEIYKIEYTEGESEENKKFALLNSMEHAKFY